jgi:hypothetical protein
MDFHDFPTVHGKSGRRNAPHSSVRASFGGTCCAPLGESHPIGGWVTDPLICDECGDTWTLTTSEGSANGAPRDRVLKAFEGVGRCIARSSPSFGSVCGFCMKFGGDDGGRCRDGPVWDEGRGVWGSPVPSDIGELLCRVALLPRLGWSGSRTNQV